MTAKIALLTALSTMLSFSCKTRNEATNLSEDNNPEKQLSDLALDQSLTDENGATVKLREILDTSRQVALMFCSEADCPTLINALATGRNIYDASANCKVTFIVSNMNRFLTQNAASIESYGINSLAQVYELNSLPDFFANITGRDFKGTPTALVLSNFTLVGYHFGIEYSTENSLLPIDSTNFCAQGLLP